MLRTCVLVGCALLGVGIGFDHASAQAKARQPRAAERTQTRAEPHEFAFEYAAGKVWIATKVNGEGPYWFGLDTGAPPTVIDSDLATQLGIPVEMSGTVGGAGEGTTPRGTARNVALEFGDGLTIKRRSMEAIQLNRRLAWANGRPVAGLIGNDWITARVVKIDYLHHRMTVYDADGWTYDGDGTIVPTKTQGYTFVNGAVKLPGEEGGDEGKTLRLRWMIDTGAGLSASLTTPFVTKHRLLNEMQPRFRASVGFGLGGEVRHQVARLDLLRLGDMEVEDPIITLSQDRAGALASTTFDGLIGGEILSKFTVIFDGQRNRMILEPNERYDDRIEFDMSGMTIVGPKERTGTDDIKGAWDRVNPSEAHLRVLRVVKGSPADEAGVREGDELVSVDGRPVAATDRDRVRMMLRTDGTKKRFEFRRGERQTVIVVLTLRRLVMNEAGDSMLPTRRPDGGIIRDSWTHLHNRWHKSASLAEGGPLCFSQGFPVIRVSRA